MQVTVLHARLPLLLFLLLIVAALLLNICLQTSAINFPLLFLTVIPAAPLPTAQPVPLVLPYIQVQTVAVILPLISVQVHAIYVQMLSLIVFLALPQLHVLHVLQLLLFQLELVHVQVYNFWTQLPISVFYVLKLPNTARPVTAQPANHVQHLLSFKTTFACALQENILTPVTALASFAQLFLTVWHVVHLVSAQLVMQIMNSIAQHSSVIMLHLLAM